MNGGARLLIKLTADQRVNPICLQVCAQCFSLIFFIMFSSRLTSFKSLLFNGVKVFVVIKRAIDGKLIILFKRK